MRHAALVIVFGLTGPAFGQTADEQAHDVVTIPVPEVADTGPRPELAAVTKSILAQTNVFRQEQKRKAVTANPTLMMTAQKFAKFMAQADKYGHTADGHTPWERAKSEGYDYCIVLENIAYAYDSQGFSDAKLAAEFGTGWRNSPPHRKNMLDADITETGVGVARSEKTGHYYAVQMFGRPKSAAIEFRITNESGREVNYTIGKKAFTLQARYTQTHTLCRVADVTFQVTGDKTSTVKPVGGERYKVTRDGETIAVSEEPN